MRCSRTVWAKFDAVASERLLKGHPEELPAAIRLNALDRERELFQHPVRKEMDGIDSGASGIQSEHAEPGAVIDRGVLDLSGSYLHGIDLNTVPWQGAIVSS
jgi:hypothetical protein